MPKPDIPCVVINAESGYARDNQSWIIGCLVAGFNFWKNDKVSRHLKQMLEDKHEYNKTAAKESGEDVEYPQRAGLCVSIYRAGSNESPRRRVAHWIAFGTVILQLLLASIPGRNFGDWRIFLVTLVGVIMSVATASLPQWKQEKNSCRSKSEKDVVLTKGNGSQHAIVILGDGEGPDFEDLAAGEANVDAPASGMTVCVLGTLAVLSLPLLAFVTEIRKHGLILMAIIGVGFLQNLIIAGMRGPEAYGLSLDFIEVIGLPKVMDTLFEVEKKYPGVGRCMLETFFPGKLRNDEQRKWDKLETSVEEKKAAKSQREADNKTAVRRHS